MFKNNAIRGLDNLSTLICVKTKCEISVKNHTQSFECYNLHMWALK